MDRTERFYRIETLIRSRGCVPFDALQAALEVSRATLNRDLLYLRDRMGAPIVYDRERGGYRFGDEPSAEAATGRAGAAPRHALPGVWFSEPEIHALLNMHQLIRGLDEGGVLARHLQPLLDRLDGMLGADAGETREALKRVKVLAAARRPVDSQHFERIGSALIRRRRLKLQHHSRARGEHGERIVSPQRLVHHRHAWYLDAWCHAKEALRRFAVDAIEAVEPLEQRAKDIPLKTLEAELDGGYGAFVGGKLQTAKLRFSARAARWVAHEQWHPQQQGRLLPDGRYLLSLPYTEPTELLMDLMRHGAEVEVLGPVALRRQLHEALAAALARAAAADPD